MYVLTNLSVYRYHRFHIKVLLSLLGISIHKFFLKNRDIRFIHLKQVKLYKKDYLCI